jgi:adenylyltransferase/sulfurtransferase
MEEEKSRYRSQELLGVIGPEGQGKLRSATVLVVGVGGLGCHAAGLLARLGVGTLRLVDGDRVEAANLHRQVLYTEEDARSGLRKGSAAAAHLGSVNSTIRIEANDTFLTAENAEELLRDASLAVDGTDNPGTRYLLNDACVHLGKPWIYGGAVETSGAVLSMKPGEGPCFRCAFPDPHAPGSLPTGETAGVLPPVVTLIASLQVAFAVRFLVTGNAPWGRLYRLDAWEGTWASADIAQAEACPACVLGRLDFLRPPGSRPSS